MPTTTLRLTPLQSRIGAWLTENGPATVAEIACGVGLSERSIDTALGWMRGRGLAQEVSTVIEGMATVEIPGFPPPRRMFSRRYPPGPRRWTTDVDRRYLHPTVAAARDQLLGTSDEDNTPARW